MKNDYMTIDKSKKFYDFLFVVVSIVAAVIIATTILLFIIPMFRKYEAIPTNIFVFGNELSSQVQEEINNAIAINIESVYHKLLSNIQLSITLFSITLGIFTIVFALIYFTRIQAAENLIKQIKETPDLFFSHFYRSQFTDNISNLFSSNYINRYYALNSISINPKLSLDDYDVLQNALLYELGFALHVYSQQNICSIANILMRIDPTRTIIIFKKIILEQKYDQLKHHNLLSHITADKSEETKQFIENLLLNNNEMGIQITTLLLSNNVIKDFINFILENCNDLMVITVIGYTYIDTYDIKIDNLFYHLSKRKDITSQTLNNIISNKKLDTKEKISLVLFFYCKNTDKFDQPLKNLIDSIKENEKAKNDFLQIANESEYIKFVKEFFIKNKREKENFTKLLNNDIFIEDVK